MGLVGVIFSSVRELLVNRCQMKGARMKSILTIATGVLTACAGPGEPGSPASGSLAASSAQEAQLYARYQQYRTGPPPHLDFETWKRRYGDSREYGNSGP